MELRKQHNVKCIFSLLLLVPASLSFLLLLSTRMYDHFVKRSCRHYSIHMKVLVVLRIVVHMNLVSLNLDSMDNRCHRRTWANNHPIVLLGQHRNVECRSIDCVLPIECRSNSLEPMNMVGQRHPFVLGCHFGHPNPAHQLRNERTIRTRWEYRNNN